MTPAEDERGQLPDGFEGELSGLGLTDLIQLNARNRFSGCFRIRYQGALGLVFFRDGEIVHAEQAERSGEEAFCDILEWPAGRFSVEPNVVTARRTIHKKVEHLLLDAHRVLDERRIVRGGTPPPRPPPARLPEPAPASRPGAVPAAPAPAAARAASTSAALEAVRATPGVTQAVVLTRDGRRVGEGGYEAEQLTGLSVYLAMTAAELGTAFQAGDLRFAAAQGQRQHLLLFVTKSHYLGVHARADAELGAVDAAIRDALAVGR